MIQLGRLPSEAALAATQKQPTKLEQAGNDFEQIMLKRMLDQMLSSLEGGGVFEKENSSSRFFQSLFSAEIARSWSETGSVGMSKMIVNSLNPKSSSSLELNDLSLQQLSRAARRPIPAGMNRLQLESMARDTARDAELDPDWVCAIIDTESGWHCNARSSKGAMGLMQLMPGTAKELGVTRTYNPQQNVAGGVRYLKDLLTRFGGDRRLAAAAYNAGPAAVERFGGVPPYAETRAYVDKIEKRLEGLKP